MVRQHFAHKSIYIYIYILFVWFPGGPNFPIVLVMTSS